jgi:type II secretory pathway component PulJ
MTKLRFIIKSQNGETLLETVLSILLLSIILTSFTFMLTASQRMVQKSAQEDQAFYDMAGAIEKQEGTTKTEQITVRDENTMDSFTCPVQVYEQGDLAAYR